MLVEVSALISWCMYSNRIVLLLVPYMWASMTFLPTVNSYNSGCYATVVWDICERTVRNNTQNHNKLHVLLTALLVKGNFEFFTCFTCRNSYERGA